MSRRFVKSTSVAKYWSSAEEGPKKKENTIQATVQLWTTKESSRERATQHKCNAEERKESTREKTTQHKCNAEERREISGERATQHKCNAEERKEISGERATQHKSSEEERRESNGERATQHKSFGVGVGGTQVWLAAMISSNTFLVRVAKSITTRSSVTGRRRQEEEV